MKIESITLKNYRAFVEPVEIRIRPLTLFFGYNSVGKSALLRVLPLIADSLDSKEAAPIALGSAAARGATFQELLPHSSLGASPQISLGLKLAATENNHPKALSLNWIIRDLPEFRQQIVERFDLAGPGELNLSAEWSPGEKEPGAKGLTRVGTRYNLKVGPNPPVETDLTFRGLVPTFDIKSRPAADALVQVATALDAILDEGPKVQWLGSVRLTPERLLRWPGSAPTMLEPDGTGAAEILAFDSAVGTIRREVSGWYEDHSGLKLNVKPLENLFRLLVEPLANSPAEVYLQDAGEGLIQALPVLVAGARLQAPGPRLPQILAVEEPESHLHPRLHAALAERFCRWAALPEPPQIVLETHSENILLRIQRAIVEKTLPKERVAAYWIRQDPQGRSQADLVEFDDLGRAKGNWMPGVFHEDLELSRQLISARRSHQEP